MVFALAADTLPWLGGGQALRGVHPTARSLFTSCHEVGHRLLLDGCSVASPDNLGRDRYLGSGRLREKAVLT